MNDKNEALSAADFGIDGLDLGGDEVATTASQTSPELRPSSADDSGRQVDLAKLKMVLDLPLKVAVELGRTKLLVNDLLQLGQGSVIELDKMAGEPMEVFVNDKLVAMGEVVVVNEKFGVRLTDVMSGMGVAEITPKDMV